MEGGGEGGGGRLLWVHCQIQHIYFLTEEQYVSTGEIHPRSRHDIPSNRCFLQISVEIDDHCLRAIDAILMTLISFIFNTVTDFQDRTLNPVNAIGCDRTYFNLSFPFVEVQSSCSLRLCVFHPQRQDSNQMAERRMFVCI